MAAALALLSSLLWGSADFLGGVMSRRLPSVAVVAWSQAVGMVGAAAAVAVSGAWHGPGGWLWWSVLAGLSGGSGLVAFYTALSTGTMGVVSPIAALGAVVPVVYGLLTGDTPSMLQSVGMVLGLGGAFAASGPELSGGARARSVLLAALAGALFGVALLSISGGAQTNALMTLLGMRATSVVLFAVAGAVLRTVGGVRAKDAGGLLLVGFGDIAANLTYAYATRIGRVSVVSVLSALYPVATVALGWAVLHERLLPVQKVGVGVALGGVVLLAVG